ncbi:MAG: hypothetical protein JWO36_5902 [Myxococcales bacterium]|nr:hypothetical protein [Myxococcales bacterium]
MEDLHTIRSRFIGVNVPRPERIASALIGAAFATLGLRYKSFLLASLGSAFVVRGITGRCPVYRMRSVRKGLEVRRSVTIQGSRQEIYDLWRDLRNLPRFMKHVKSVEIEGDISHWHIKEGPLELKWRAEIVEDSPGRRLRWRSLPGGDLVHEGVIDLRDAPAGRGTIVEVKMLYKPPGGLIVAGLFNGILRRLPGLQMTEELARLRQLVETGEIATGARNPGELDATEQPKLPMTEGLAQGRPAAAGVSP